MFEIIDRDPELSKRDLEARLHKIQLWKLQRKKYAAPADECDEDEEFQKWWTPFDD